MCVAHSALLTYRPAYQSSVYVGGLGSYNASLANDGSRETVATKASTPSCAISLNETNPWWAVDLGRPTTIYGVNFTNRESTGT